MKYFKYVSVVLVFAFAALAVKETLYDKVNSPRPQWFQSPIYIGNVANNPVSSTTNKVSRTLSASATIDFATATITCTDSSAIVLTGARVNDPCFVGPPTTISGAATGLNSTFSCYVSAADNVKVRHCAAGTADDPASAIFAVRVFSNQ